MQHFKAKMWYTFGMKRHCTSCRKELVTRHQIKFCSNKCQSEKRYEDYISSWKDNVKKGGFGQVTKNISQHLKRYLIRTHGERCIICGWNKKNIETGRVPIEVDHIDGSAENNREENLRLLCPNCHSLTPHFRNLNRGNGRSWRRK